jgi:ABC-type multidrug transport system ATPase subunit
VAVVWRPFLLGPIFQRLGWASTPFAEHPAKQAYLWRDLARQAEKYGLAFRQPARFPQPAVLATRLAVRHADADWLPDWMRVEELVEMFRDFYGTPSQAKAYIGFDADKANEMLARLNIAPNARLKTLSKGNKEKVQLVLAMSRNARLYLLDEPIGGVDPAARDYILNTIISNYSKDATVVISTHLIEDIEPVLDEAVFLKDGRIFAHRAVDDIRETEGKSVDAYFREVFKC